MSNRVEFNGLDLSPQERRTTSVPERDVIVMKKGYLTKQGGFWKTWKRRYFVLKQFPNNSFNFAYYKSENYKKEKPFGFIELNGAVVGEPTKDSKPKPYTFTIGPNFNGGRTYFIVATSEQEKQEWMTKLQEALSIITATQQRSLTLSQKTTEKEESQPKEERGSKLDTEFDDLVALIEQKEKQVQVQRVIIAQSAVRTFLQRLKYKKARKGIILAQSLWRRKLSISLLKILKKRNIQRSRIANEICTTEQTYASSLGIVVELFQLPLLKGTIIPSDAVREMFSNIDILTTIHKGIADNLYTRIKNWKPHQRISDIFLDTMRDLYAYIPYVKNFDNSQKLIKKYKAENAIFLKYIEDTQQNPRMNMLDLPDYLIMPVQRLPRIELLLKDILKFTEPDTLEYSSTEKALEEIRQMTQLINEQKKESDSIQRILEVQSKVRGKKKDKPMLLAQGRVLIREGALVQYERGNPIKAYLFVFNDMLLTSKQTSVRKKLIDKTVKYDYQDFIPTRFCTLEEHVSSRTNSVTEKDDSPSSRKRNDIPKGLPQSELELCFRIVDNRPDGAGSLLFKASHSPEKTKWLSDLKGVIEAATKQFIQQQQDMLMLSASTSSGLVFDVDSNAT